MTRSDLRRHGVRAALLAAAAAGLVVAAVLQATSGSPRTSPRPRAASVAASFRVAAAGVPEPSRPAFTVRRPVLLNRSAAVSRWAPVLRDVSVRARPDAASRSVAELSRLTPEGTTNLVLAIGEVQTNGNIWTHVRLPVLPNNRTGWVPRGALGGYNFVHTHLMISLERLTATLLDDGRAIFRAPIGVGKDAAPTPTGQFYIREKLTRFRSPFYGPMAFGTSARSNVLTDWPGGGFIGIHGTNEPELIPGRVSHGCIRLRNQDILTLARLMPVGTPVTIQ